MQKHLFLVGRIAAALAVGLFLYATYAGDDTLRLLTKPWPVAILAVALHLNARDAYGLRIRDGLAASVVGDVLLEFDGGFLPGMVAFLVAHLCYVGAFVGEERKLYPLRSLPFALWGVATWLHLRPGLEAAGMANAVGIYTLVICSMLWRASARLGRDVGTDVKLAFGGALLFAVSDTMIAYDRFDPTVTGSPYWIIGLYWLGQWGIARSTIRSPN